MSETLVYYECTAAAHREREGGPDKLTVHEGQWAFCPFETHAEGHQWSRIESGFSVEVMILRHRDAMRVQGELAERREQNAPSKEPIREGPSGSPRKSPGTR